MYLCVRGIDSDSFYDFSIGFWNCSDNWIFFVFHFIEQHQIGYISKSYQSIEQQFSSI